MIVETIAAHFGLQCSESGFQCSEERMVMALLGSGMCMTLNVGFSIGSPQASVE